MRRTTNHILSLALILGALQGCAGDLSQELEQELEQEAASADPSDDTTGDSGDDEASSSDSGDDEGGEEDVSHFTHYPQDDGTTLTLVNATDSQIWVYLNLEDSEEVRPANPVEDGSWDIGFQRYKLKLNGGYFGTGGVMAAAIEGVTFDEVTQAPDDGWEFDRADIEDDDDEDPEHVFGGWYDYDPSTHVLTPKTIVYVVRTVEGNFYKVAMAGYYDEEGESGYPSIRWASVDAPSGTLVEPSPEPVGDVPLVEPGAGDDTTTDDGTDDSGSSDEGSVDSEGTLVDASDTQIWAYLSLRNGIVTVEDEMTSYDWDLAILRTNFRTNSGSSGPGIAGVARMPGSDNYEPQATADTVGYYSDVLITPEWPENAPTFSGNDVLGSWYNYDMSTHTVTPRDEFYLLRTASGEYAKLLIHGYESGIFDLSWEFVDRAPQENTVSVELDTESNWTHLSLRTGSVVEVTGDDDLSWDLAFLGTKVRTNSGTSGPGLGGVVATELTDLADVSVVTDEVPTPDGEVAFEGADGATVTSANPALDSWYNYNTETHEVTSKGLVYQIATSGGDFAKVRFDSYEAGQIQISWVYAGPGEYEY